MKVCLVTAFPPSREKLNDYGYHLACELQRDPHVSVTVLADRLTWPADELPDFNVVRCWDYRSVRNIAGILKEVRRQHPDVVWFNLAFPRFFERPIAAVLGFFLPPACRMLGYAWPILIL